MNLIEKGISNSYLFTSLSEEEIKIIGNKCERVNYKKGEVIIKEGEKTSGLFIILKGCAKVITHLGNYEIFLSFLKPYSVIGEIAFIDNEATSADVITTEPCIVARIPHNELKLLMENFPNIAIKIWNNLSLLLAKRIRKSNEIMRSYFGINKALCDNEEFRKFFSECYYSLKE